MKFSNKLLKRSTTLALLLITGSALTGCIADEFSTSALDTPAPFSGSDNYPITVAKGPVTLEVSSHAGTLQPTQINAVIGFAHQARSAGRTPVTIRRPSGGGKSARVASEIASLMVQQGVSRNMVRVATYSAPAGAPVNVSFVTTYASTRPCGEWNEDVTSTDDNRNREGHGCAVQSNIAAMIADPETLIVPAPTTPIQAASRVRALTVATAAPSSSTSTKSLSRP